MTDAPDPAAIAASLTLAQTKLVRKIVDEAGVYGSPRRGSLRVLGDRGVVSGMRLKHPNDPDRFCTLTPLGRAVAAAIREREG